MTQLRSYNTLLSASCLHSSPLLFLYMHIISGLNNTPLQHHNITTTQPLKPPSKPLPKNRIPPLKLPPHLPSPHLPPRTHKPMNRPLPDLDPPLHGPRQRSLPRPHLPLVLLPTSHHANRHRYPRRIRGVDQARVRLACCGEGRVGAR